MADLVVTPAKVALIDPHDAEVYDFIAAVAITAGKAFYVNASGKAALADASVAGTAGVRGIALQSVGAGQAFSGLKRERIAGFTIPQAYDAPIYLSDTDAGILADAAGTVNTIVGRVVPMSDAPNLTKVIYVDCQWS